MILALDTGNTHTIMGCIEKRGEGIVVTKTVQISTNPTKTAYEYAVEIKSIMELAGIDPTGFEGAIISSVVPQINIVLQKAIRLVTGCDAWLLGAGVRTGLNIRLDDPGTIAGDLVAAHVMNLSFSGQINAVVSSIISQLTLSGTVPAEVITVIKRQAPTLASLWPSLYAFYGMVFMIVVVTTAGAVLAMLVMVVLMLLIIMMMVMMFVFVLIVVVMMVMLMFLFKQSFQLIIESVLLCHGISELLACQQIPVGSNDGSLVIQRAEPCNNIIKPVLRNALGVAEYQTACVSYLVVEELTEILLVHLALCGVNNSGEAVKHNIVCVDILHRLDNVAELADTRRLDKDTVGFVGLQHLNQCLAEIAHQ